MSRGDVKLRLQVVEGQLRHVARVLHAEQREDLLQLILDALRAVTEAESGVVRPRMCKL